MQNPIPSKLENQKIIFNNDADDNDIENITVYGVHEIPEEHCSNGIGGKRITSGGVIYIGQNEYYAVERLERIEEENGKIISGWSEWVVVTKRKVA